MKKGLLIGLAVIALLAVIVAKNFNPVALLGNVQTKNDATIAELQAYHYGVMAYVYGYPLVDMYKQMHNETHRVSPDQQTYAPANRFYRFPNLVEPQTQGNLRAPNNDTLYFTAWFDISDEPLIIHTPNTAGRYFTIAVTNQYAEVTHIGRRTTGTEEAYYALVRPGWQGKLPEGVKVVTVETPYGWLLGRMLVDGSEDFPAAMALVNDIWTASLDEFSVALPPPMPAEIVAQEIDPLPSLEFFAVLNKSLKQLPIRPGEIALMALFDQIGIGPGSKFDAATLDDASRKGLERALVDGQALVAAATRRTIADYNGWMISQDIGRYGYLYLHRAAVVKGGYGNLPEESLYPAALFDGEGEALTGSEAYRLHFPAGQLPPVNGFWSLAVYTLDSKLAENEIGRYSIGDRTSGLVFNQDGSLTIALQHTRPDNASLNWLPTPAGSFFAVMRLYEPSPAALRNEYRLPRIERVADR